MPGGNSPSEQLSRLYGLLAVHPEFRVATPPSPAQNRVLLWSGGLLAAVRLCVRGVRFAGGASLLAFQLTELWPRKFTLDFHWRAPGTAKDSEVVTEFRAPDGAVAVRDRWSLAGYPPDAFGFIYPRRSVHLPEDAPAGKYRAIVSVTTKGGELLRPAWRVGFPLGPTRFEVLAGRIRIGDPAA